MAREVSEASYEYYTRFEKYSPEKSADKNDVYKHSYTFRLDELLNGEFDLKNLELISQDKTRFVIRSGNNIVVKNKDKSAKNFTLQSAIDELRILAESMKFSHSNKPNYYAFNIASNEEISLHELNSFLKNDKNLHVANRNEKLKLVELAQIEKQQENKEKNIELKSKKIKRKSQNGKQLSINFPQIKPERKLPKLRTRSKEYIVIDSDGNEERYFGSSKGAETLAKRLGVPDSYFPVNDETKKIKNGIQQMKIKTDEKKKQLTNEIEKQQG